MYWGVPSVSRTSKPLTQEEIFRRYAILAFEPGERELYSNLGISLLTHAIEQVAHQSYADYLTQNVFLPLGLKNTVILSSPPVGDEFAQQYDISGKPWTYEAGFYASAHDLVRFGMFHLKDRVGDQKAILSDSVLDLMQTSIDPVSDFRLPWWVWSYKGYQALVFTGASGTIIALAPEADLAIVVLANRLQADTPRICRLIADVLLDDSEEQERIPTQVRTSTKSRQPPLSRASLLGLWKGSIITPERTFPVVISFGNSGLPQMRAMDLTGNWGSWVETMPSLRGSYVDGVFSAYFPIQIPIDDTKGHDHWTWIYVGMRGASLQGYAVAHAASGPYFGLPYYIRLER